MTGCGDTRTARTLVLRVTALRLTAAYTSPHNPLPVPPSLGGKPTARSTSTPSTAPSAPSEAGPWRAVLEDKAACCSARAIAEATLWRLTRISPPVPEGCARGTHRDSGEGPSRDGSACRTERQGHRFHSSVGVQTLVCVLRACGKRRGLDRKARRRGVYASQCTEPGQAAEVQAMDPGLYWAPGHSGCRAAHPEIHHSRPKGLSP